MLVEVKEKGRDVINWTYPSLVRSVEFGSLVLVAYPTGDKTFSGTVISNEKKNNTYKIGYYSEAWNKDRFELFEGTITLSNE